MKRNGTNGQKKGQMVSPETVMKRIKPGMSIFLGTGVAEPRTLVKHLLAEEAGNLQDLELIQIVSLGDAIAEQEAALLRRYRLKTFFSGWVAGEAITAGRVDLIPSRFSRIPRMIESGRMSIDAAFVQVTPPSEAGYCSLGTAVDAARQAMERASLVVGEVNPHVPNTFGDTFVSVEDFDFLVEATEPPIYFDRWKVDDVFDQVAANVASVVEDGSCLGFSIGPLFEALGRHLVNKRNLGIHSPFITDALMDLIKSGAVSNRYKEIYRGKSVASYAFGSRDLMKWLDRNPLIDFQGIDTVFSPTLIGRNPRFVAIFPARKVDLSGRIAVKTMPHSKMQGYVNVDYRKVMSIVGVVGEHGKGRIIAEARFVKDPHRPYADIAFVVDEEYQGLGIATFLYKKLVQLAKERGVEGLTADVPATNKAMMKVIEKGG
jgi:acyl-CoA hydrolase